MKKVNYDRLSLLTEKYGLQVNDEFKSLKMKEFIKEAIELKRLCSEFIQATDKFSAGSFVMDKEGNRFLIQRQILNCNDNVEVKEVFIIDSFGKVLRKNITELKEIKV